MTDLSATPSVAWLQQLLRQGGWQSSRSAIAEAMPHLSESHGQGELAQTLENLGIPYDLITCKDTEITSGEVPALALFPDGTAGVLVDVIDETLLIEELEVPGDPTPTPKLRPFDGSTCTLLQIEVMKPVRADAPKATVANAFAVLYTMIPSLLLASFMSNIIGLATPLLIMVIYDRVIPSSSSTLLLSLTIGVLFLVLADFSFRRLRTRALSYTGSQSELDLTLMLFRKMMSLPLSQMERSSFNQHLSRFRQFEGLREIFTGQIMAALLDLPFALIFFAVLYWLAPQVAFWVAGCVFILALLAVIWVPKQLRLDRAAAETGTKLTGHMSDAVKNQMALVNLGLAESWHQRATSLAEASESDAAASQNYRTLMTLAAQSLVGLTTVGAILISTYGALEANITFGALIAVITLAGKILSPFHALYGSLPQIYSSFVSRQQADRILSLPEEKELGLWHFHQKTLQGHVRFNAVTFRPDPLNPPVLSQVSFAATAAETVVIMGSDLVARTSILDLVDGLYDPLIGNIEHDEIDIRQIAKDELRRSIGYASFESTLFHGTLAQNIRLAAPEFDKTSLEELLSRFDLMHHFSNGDEWYNTRLNHAKVAKFTDAEVKSLCLVRTMCRTSPIQLFAEPTGGLTNIQRDAFKAWVAAQGSDKTIFISTADRSLLKLADRCIYIDGGRVLVDGTSDAGGKKMLAALNKNGS